MRYSINCLFSTLLLLVLLPGMAMAQTGTVTGTVIDGETGETLPGANILLIEENVGAITNADGVYTIAEVPAGTHTVRATFVGYEAQEQQVTVEAGETVTQDFELQADIAGLEEVVVIGYGERQRRDLTGSVASISAEQIETQPVTTPENLLQGRTAGVQVTSTSGVAGSTVNVRVRGPSSIQGGNQPLYVVDGVPITSGKTAADVGQGTNALADINPADIESMEVLKDASATAIYGSRGANGVVLITTKRGRAQEHTDINRCIWYYLLPNPAKADA